MPCKLIERLSLPTKDEDAALNKVLLIVQCMGFLEPRSLQWKTLYRIYGVFIYFTFLYCLMISQIIALLTAEDMILVIDNSFMLTEMIVLAMNVHVFTSKSQTIWKAIETLSSTRNIVQNMNFKLIQGRNELTHATFWKYYFSMVAIGVTLVGFYPLVSGNSREVPMSGWLPLDITKSTANFVIVYVWQFGCMFHEAIVLFTSELLLIFLLSMACNSFDIMTDAILTQILYFPDEDAYNIKNASKSDTYQSIVRCIQQHQAILSFVHDFDHIYGAVFLLRYGVGMLTLSFNSYLLTMASLDTAKTVYVCFFQVVVLYGTFMYSWFATQLYYKSMTLTDAIIMSHWTKSDLKTQQALKLIILQSNRPIILRGKIVIVGMPAFVQMIRTSYSIYTLMSQMGTKT